MKTKNELCEELHSVTYQINVFSDTEVISSGTGVAINKMGDLLTAAHVIDAGKPLQKGEINDLKIQARGADGEVNDYTLVYCGIEDTVEEFKSPVKIDLALIKKKRNLPLETPFFRSLKKSPDSDQWF